MTTREEFENKKIISIKDIEERIKDEPFNKVPLFFWENYKVMLKHYEDSIVENMALVEKLRMRGRLNSLLARWSLGIALASLIISLNRWWMTYQGGP